VFEDNEKAKKIKQPKKITKQRLKNIALYYVKRFETSTSNLRQVLLKRVSNYAHYYPEWDKKEALLWVDEVVKDFVARGYIDDNRYAEMKIKNYITAGKSVRYIKTRLKQKGINESIVDENIGRIEYSQFDAALLLAKKKRIGPFRDKSIRKDFWQKDFGVLIRAGFDYDVVQDVLAHEE